MSKVFQEKRTMQNNAPSKLLSLLFSQTTMMKRTLHLKGLSEECLSGNARFESIPPFKRKEKSSGTFQVMNSDGINLHIFLSGSKGQVISKCLFGVFTFFQKTNENKSHTSKNEFIRSFFGRIHGLTICFRN